MDPAHEAHVARILDHLNRELHAKYTKGQQEHGGNLWRKPGLLGAAIEEVIDLAVYLYTLREQQDRPGAGTRKVIYVAGPFRGPNSWAIEGNIRRAETLALAVWQAGAAAICPHTNTRFFQGAADDEVRLEGDLAILHRCDAVLMTDDWRRSSGATAEHEYALAHDLPVFYEIDSLRAWLRP